MIRREAAARAIAADLLRELGEGMLRLDVTTYPLERVNDALELAASGAARGRIVLEP
jgi:D-arabinose 1-dehydrogenase-like Zn-dependent alcohol dehydrogenase